MQLSTGIYIDKRKDNTLCLDGVWSFTDVNAPVEVPASLKYEYNCTLPASVYMNVHEAGLLPHPYSGTNSALYRDLDRKVWYFRKKFCYQKDASFERENHYLCFDGIGYYSRIYLNSTLLGEHDGMFGGPAVEVSEVLRDGENELIAEVRAFNYAQTEEERKNYNAFQSKKEIIPWNIAKDSYTSNGHFNVFGIWRSVRLVHVEKLHMARPYLFTESIDRENKSAALSLLLEIVPQDLNELSQVMSGEDGDYTFTYPNGLSGVLSGKSVRIGIALFDSDNGRNVYSTEEDFDLYDYAKSGIVEKYRESQYFRTEIKLNNIEYWYPNTRGEAKLYDVKLTLSENGQKLDELTFRTGIRKIELCESAGPRYRRRWEKFAFSVNGERFFLKGMNWMPTDYLFTQSDADYAWALEEVKNAGIQLLRVWSGGGMPEDDRFYDLCDKYGIMVWQDSFLANGDSPLWNNEILENQICMNLFRIRNHPSLAVHCGGNEHRAYNKSNNAAMYIIERNIADLDPSRKFYRASPDGGSMHSYRDWEPVWYRKVYKDLPLMAECGLHCFPNAKSLRQLINAGEYNGKLDNIMEESFRKDFPELLNHFTEYQPERIPRMLSRATHITSIKGSRLPDLCEATQLSAYEFYTFLIQSLRERYPVTVGVMPWVFKRGWTTVAIQMIDGLGETTAPYYAVKSAYAPVMVFASLCEVDYAPGETLSIPVRVICDSGREFSGKTVLEIYSPKFERVLRKEYDTLVNGNRYLTDIADERFAIPDEWKNSYFYVRISLENSDGVINQSFYPILCHEMFTNKAFRDDFRENPHENLFFENGPHSKDAISASTESDLHAEIRERKVCGDRLTLKVLLKAANAPAYPVKLEIVDDDTVSYLSDNFFFLGKDEERIVEMETRNKGDKTRNLILNITAWNAKTISFHV